MKHLVYHSFCTIESTKKDFSNFQGLGKEIITIDTNINI